MNRATSSDEDKHGPSPWLASLILRQGADFWPRFAAAYRAVRRRTRSWRRTLRRGTLRRRLGVTVAGAALLLALSWPVTAVQPPSGEPPGAIVNVDPAAFGAPLAPLSPGAVITVVNGEVEVIDNGKCSLIEAIINARTVNINNMRADCVSGDPIGPDTINLPKNGLFVLTTANNVNVGANGLPAISTEITINGNGSTIRRSTASGIPRFRILKIDPGGSLTIRNATITGGNAPGYPMPGYEYEEGEDGGAILNQGTLIVEALALKDNHAIYGSAIMNEGHLTARNIAVIDNFASSYDAGYSGAGAIYNSGSAVIVGSLLESNSGRGSGAIDNSGVMSITNTTISDNWSKYGAGAIWNSNDGRLTLNNSTVTGNGNYHDGEMVDGIFNSGHLTLNRSIFTGNSYNQSNPYTSDLNIQNGYGTVVTNNQNIFGYGGQPRVAGFTIGLTDIIPVVDLSAILSPLSDNGGPTMTHALPPGSPAIDRAPNQACNAVPVGGVDQRGFTRNVNGVGGVTSNDCDIGAFEFGASAPTPTSSPPPPTATATPKPTRTPKPTNTPRVSPTPTSTLAITETPSITPTTTPPVTATPTGDEQWIYLPLLIR